METLITIVFILWPVLPRALEKQNLLKKSEQGMLTPTTSGSMQ